MKVAKLVKVEFTTIVIVDSDASELETLELAKQGFINKIENDELIDNLVEIVLDREMPYE